MFSQAFSAMSSSLASYPASLHTQLSWQSWPFREGLGFHSIAPSQHHCPTQAPYSSPWWVNKRFAHPGNAPQKGHPCLISSKHDTSP